MTPQEEYEQMIDAHKAALERMALNAFALTMDGKRLEDCIRVGLITLSGIAERRLWSYATMRGGIDCVTLYAVDRAPFTAPYKGHSERDKKITVRFSV